MKKIIAFLLAILLLTGCSANKPAEPEVPEETPAVTEPAQAEEDELAGMDRPMTEEEAAAAEAAMEAKQEELSKTKAIPIGIFDAPTIYGENRTEALFADADLTVINIWGTYCEPCKEEMPVLAQLHEELEGVQFLGVLADCTDADGNAIDSQVELAVDLAEAAGCTYDNLLLNMDLAEVGFGAVSAIPATIFVDKDGNTVGHGFYGALDETGWREIINERLEIAQGRYE